MELEQCLRLLRASSDEEKFVGLYLVTKIIKTGGHDPAALAPTLRLIWDAVGFPFLQRMLRTESKAGGAEGFSYRGLALSIMAAFSVDESLATDPRFVSTVPTLAQIVHPSSHSENEVVRDALQCMIGVCHSAEGIKKLAESNTLPAILLGVSEEQPLEELKARLHLSDKLIRYMQSHHVAVSTEADNMLQHLASIFRHNQRALKFLIMERLPAILLVCFEPQHQMGDKSTVQAQEHRAWIEDIRVGLFYILVSKIGRLHKEQALTLCASLLRYFGESWTIGTIPPLETGGSAGGETSDSRFVEVMMIQTGVETRLLLDSYMHPEIMQTEANGAKKNASEDPSTISALPSWEQEAKRKTSKLPPEAMMYAPSLPLPASSASASYAIEDMDSDEDESQDEPSKNPSPTSSSSSSASSSSSPPADALMELLSAPPDDSQAHFEHAIAIYYEILEHAITFLAAADKEDEVNGLTRRSSQKEEPEGSSWVDFNFQALENIKKVLSDVFETILDFVRDVQREKEQQAKETKQTKGKEKTGEQPVRLTLEALESMNLESTSEHETERNQGNTSAQVSGDHVRATDAVIIATMRLLGLWISHDHETLKDAVTRVLPFLINLKTESVQIEIDPFSFLLPGLVPLTQEDDARDKFIDADGHIRLLAFMASEVELQKKKQSSGAENFGPLVSCLGVLLNLVCLEEGLVNHRDPTTFACYVPVLVNTLRLAETSSVPNSVRDREKVLVLAHALVATAFILKFHTAESIRHHQQSLKEDLSARGVHITVEPEMTSLLQMVADTYFKLCTIGQQDRDLWEDVSELWFMATEAIRSSLQTHPALGVTMRTSVWLPKAVSVADKADGHVRAALRSVTDTLSRS